MAKKTPIAFFTYNRPRHAHHAFETLDRCSRLDECQVHIFVDGLRNETHRAGWEASQQVVDEWRTKLHAELMVRPQNLGVALSVVNGVTDLCRDYGRVIVIEDDFVLNPDYVRYMLEGLDCYEHEPKVHQISGYMWPVQYPNPTGRDAFFMPFTTAWGWATWARAWQHFQWSPTGTTELLADELACTRFNLNGGVNYTKILRQSLEHPQTIYDIMWQYAVFKQAGLVAHPRRSLVWNGGMDGSGTFSKKERHFAQVPLAEFSRPAFGEKILWPEKVELDVDAFAHLTDYLRRLRARKPPLHIRAWHKLNLYLKPFLK